LANPAVTIGRAFTDSFSGIRPADMPAFIMAQMLGASAVVPLGAYVFGRLKND
jgi:glycerol uptake facilitator-like aquaporin